ncbi:MAG: hypothetical protein AAGJ40_05930 [Planctomycetota bacterium]
MRLFQSTAAAVRQFTVAGDIRGTFASILNVVSDVSAHLVMPHYAMPALRPVSQSGMDHRCPRGWLSHLPGNVLECERPSRKRMLRRR